MAYNRMLIKVYNGKEEHEHEVCCVDVTIGSEFDAAVNKLINIYLRDGADTVVIKYYEDKRLLDK